MIMAQETVFQGSKDFSEGVEGRKPRNMEFL